MTIEPLNPIRPPIILLGMHRSGTSLIARLLEGLGLFQGHDLQDDHESVYFMEVNDLLLKRAGGSWDHPQAVIDLLRDPRAMELAARCVRADLLSRRPAPYLGLKRRIALGSIENLDAPWGWKDPRTIFTLPLWAALFPRARIVYIIRNGVDVAASLRVREERELTRRLAEFPAKSRQLARHSLLERASFRGSARCLTLDGAFGLWEQYVARAQAVLADLPNERMTIRYERFLSHPADAQAGVAAMAAFCGINAAPPAIEQAIEQIQPDRAAAFRTDRELIDFHQRVKQSQWMRRHGYDQPA